MSFAAALAMVVGIGACENMDRSWALPAGGAGGAGGSVDGAATAPNATRDAAAPDATPDGVAPGAAWDLSPDLSLRPDAGDSGQATAGQARLPGDAATVTPFIPCPPEELVLTAEELAAASKLSPLPPPPPDPTNAVADNPAAARLGKMLYHDDSYSGFGPSGPPGVPGLAWRSCQTCHQGPSLAQSSLIVPYGGPGAAVRDGLSLLDASQYRWVNWGGRFATQWELPLVIAEKPGSLDSNRMRVVRLVYEKYRADYEPVFGRLDPGLRNDTARFPLDARPKAAAAVNDGAWERMTAGDRDIVNRVFVNYGKAIAAYLRTLRSGPSRFDRFVAGDRAALSCAAQRGFQLFVGKGSCATCHGGPFFTDQTFRNMGLSRLNMTGFASAPDHGRAADAQALLASPFNPDSPYSDDGTTGRLAGLRGTPEPDAAGAFRTPTLRNVALSAPYLHDGSLRSLREVVEFHNTGGGRVVVGLRDPDARALGLTASEILDLVAFLESLTSDPIAPPPR
jgi:cytochrome c peroxidase